MLKNLFTSNNSNNFASSEIVNSLMFLPKSCTCTACISVRDSALKELGKTKYKALTSSLGITI